MSPASKKQRERQQRAVSYTAVDSSGTRARLRVQSGLGRPETSQATKAEGRAGRVMEGKGATRRSRLGKRMRQEEGEGESSRRGTSRASELEKLIARVQSVKIRLGNENKNYEL